MSINTPDFVHEYRPGTIHYGRGCIRDIGTAVADRGFDDVLVVCGRNVGSNEALMTPVREGLGDLLAGVFDETTSAKSIETVYDCAEQVTELDADVLVVVGGGSSLDIATGVSILARNDRSLEETRREIVQTGTLKLPDNTDELLPMIPVPTTLAGADLSVAAGLVAPSDNGPVEGIVADEALMPEAFFYDPDLFDTTPDKVLAGSAINGFDKGIEAIYSRFGNPVTDATAIRGLRYLRSSLPSLLKSSDPDVMDRAVMGTILVQYGVSIPDAYKINVVHAFGHALRNQFGIQQGIAHAVIVPHVLRLIFEEGGGRPEVLAEGLVEELNPENIEEAVIESVEAVRDGLELPSRLRDVDGTTRDELRLVAEYTYADDFLDVGPSSFDPSIDDIEQTLVDAW